MRRGKGAISKGDPKDPTFDQCVPLITNMQILVVIHKELREDLF